MSNDVQNLVNELKRIDGDIKISSGTTINYLGMTIQMNEDKISISMSNFIDQFVTSCGGIKPSFVPADPSLFVTKKDSPLLQEREKRMFHSRVMSIMYLGKRIRPDILIATNYLSSRVTNPTIDDWSKLERLIGYVQFTRDKSLTFIRSNNNDLTLFVDASYGNREDRKSQSGDVLRFRDCTIDCGTTKQSIVTKSPAEAEMVAASDAGSKLLHYRRVLQSLKIPCDRVIMYQDNELLCNGRSSSGMKTKHIDIRRYWLKQHVDSEEISIKYCPTERMLADILTKPLTGATFVYLRDLLLGHTVQDYSDV